jgi:hypothetical protein
LFHGPLTMGCNWCEQRNLADDSWVPFHFQSLWILKCEKWKKFLTTFTNLFAISQFLWPMVWDAGLNSAPELIKSFQWKINTFGSHLNKHQEQ